MIDKSATASVNALAFSPWWVYYYFVWKVSISLFFIYGADYNNYICYFICALVAISGIWVYTATCVYLFYFIYMKNNGKHPYLFRDPLESLSLFIPIIYPEVSQSESKYIFVEYFLFFIGITMVFIAIILHFIEIRMNDIVSLWYTLCFIPLFISMILYQVWIYLHPKSLHLYFVSTSISFVSLWILICIILQNDFKMDIDSLYVSLPMIVLFICLDTILDWTLIAQTPMFMFAALFCYFIPFCFTACSWITFIVLWIIYFSDNVVFTMSVVFIPIWIIFLFQTCHLCVGMCTVYDIDSTHSSFILKHEVVISHLNDENLLNQLNKALQHKRETEIGDNKVIDLWGNNGDNKENEIDQSLITNKVFYRLRCNDIVADIISPNHVSFNKAAYQKYTNNDINIEELLDELDQIDKSPHPQLMYAPIAKQMEFEAQSFYQWIPTQFQIRFKGLVRYFFDNLTKTI